MQRQAGFTLIELMITMVVLAILSAIAIPSYIDYVRRGKIPEATSNLQAMKTKMEQYFQDNRTYPVNGCAQAPTAPTAGQIQVPLLQHFTITCNPAPTANTYTIVASGGVADPAGDQSMTGIVFTIDQSNNRTTTVTSGTSMGKAGYTGAANCWVTRKGGVC